MESRGVLDNSTSLHMHVRKSIDSKISKNSQVRTHSTLHYPLSSQNMITVYDYTESILLSLDRRNRRLVNTNRFVQSLQQTAVSVVLSLYKSCQAQIDVQQIDRLSHTLCKIGSLERDCVPLQLSNQISASYKRLKYTFHY